MRVNAVSPSQQPQIYDAVLGGQVFVPLGGVVLGGLEGAQQRLSASGSTQRLPSLRVRRDAAVNLGPLPRHLLGQVSDLECL